jgi:hypothetical protein
MRELITPLCVSIVVLVTSCGERLKEKVASLPSPTVEKIELQEGALDEKGQLVIFPGVVLETDYALIFRIADSGDTPKPRYDFASRESGFESFTDLGQLEARLRRIPPPRIIDFYTTCGGPLWYNLPQGDIDAFFGRMQDLDVELRGERPDGKFNAICTCP